MSQDKPPITVAGKTYASIEEMPTEIRRVYERAMEARNREHADAQVKLVFNGQEYESLDEMPADVRKLYQAQQVAMETYRDFSVDATTPRAAKPAAAAMNGRRRLSKRQKLFLAGAAVVVLVLLVLLFR